MNNELLKRIEKLETLTARLEQGIQDIWGSCSCLRKDLDDFPDLPEDGITFCPEPPDDIEFPDEPGELERPEEPEEEYEPTN